MSAIPGLMSGQGNSLNTSSTSSASSTSSSTFNTGGITFGAKSNTETIVLAIAAVFVVALLIRGGKR